MNKEVRKFVEHGWFKDSTVELRGLDECNIGIEGDGDMILFVMESSIFAFKIRYLIAMFFASIGNMIMLLVQILQR